MPSDQPGTSRVGLPGRGVNDLPGLQDEAGDVLRGESGSVRDPAAFEPVDEDTTLGRAVALRFPDINNHAHPGAKAEQLQEHIVRTAIMRGELADLRLRAALALHRARDEWSRLDGWERYKRRSSDKTQAADEAAKARMRPDLARIIADGQWTIARCTEEMKRMDADYESASRAYTILSG